MLFSYEVSADNFEREKKFSYVTTAKLFSEMVYILHIKL